MRFFIDKQGNKLFGKSYVLISPYIDGIAEICATPTKCGFINKKGEPITPIKYQATSTLKNGIAAVLLNGKCGFMYKKGKEIIQCEFDWTGLIF